MSELEKSNVVENGRYLSKFFEIDLSIKILGRVIFYYHFPPKQNI